MVLMVVKSRGCSVGARVHGKPGLIPFLLLCAVEPLNGNLVKKECADSCTSNYSQHGQVSSGSEVIQCCQGDLCNERLHSAAPAPALLSSATLGLAMSLSLFALMVLKI